MQKVDAIKNIKKPMIKIKSRWALSSLCIEQDQMCEIITNDSIKCKSNPRKNCIIRIKDFFGEITS